MKRKYTLYLCLLVLLFPSISVAQKSTTKVLNATTFEQTNALMQEFFLEVSRLGIDSHELVQRTEVLETDENGNLKLLQIELRNDVRMTNFDKEKFQQVQFKSVSPDENIVFTKPKMSEDTFIVVEQMPQPLQSLASIQTLVHYPEMARRAGVEGTVVLQFVVDEQGSVTNPKVVRGVGAGCDEEALRVVQTLKFKPGIQKGKPVKVQFALPIRFKLNSVAETSASPANKQTPTEYSLKNYPNPFNPTTTIEFAIPTSEHVTIEVFNLLGQKVATVVDQRLDAGIHSINFDGSSYATGRYLYRLTTPSTTISKEFTLLK